MKVEVARPPNYAELRARFDPPPGTVFAWGDIVYAPDSDGTISDHLMAHEAVHGRQQAASGGPAAWWARYVDDPAFRLEQEVEAYRAQWRVARLLPRPERREVLAFICKSLASRMYGGLVTKQQARQLVTRAQAPLPT